MALPREVAYVDPTGAARSISGLFNTGSGRDYAKEGSLRDSKWNTYIQTAAALGVTPDLDAAAFGKKFDSWSDSEGGLAGLIEKELYPKAANKYNEALRAYNKAQGVPTDPGALIPTTWNTSTMGDWRGKGAGWMAEQVLSVGDKAKQYQAGATTAAEEKSAVPTYKYEPEKDTLAQQVEGELQAIISRGTPTFVKPEFNDQYVTQWSEKLAALEQPNVDWALGKLNKQVGEQYAFYNPYSLGSGGQIKASEQAANELLMTTLANRNAQALALGKEQYAQDYNQAYAEYQRQLAQREAAFGGLTDISRYRQQAAAATSDQERQNYFDIMNRNRQLADVQAAQAYDTAMYNRQVADTERIAAMYQPQSQDQLANIASGALTGAATGFMYGGPTGALVGAGVGGLASGLGGTPQSAAQLGGATGYGFSRYNQPVQNQSYYNPASYLSNKYQYGTGLNLYQPNYNTNSMMYQLRG